MPSRLRLDRKQLASLFKNNHQAIVAFEKVLGDLDFGLPTTIEEAAAQATQALAVAGQALSMVQSVMEAIEALESAPAAAPKDAPDDTVPRVEIGTLAAQNADAVRVGALDAEGPITSTLTGAPPLVVASAVRVDNLRAATADLADKLAGPTTFPAVATDLPTAITLVNALRAAAINKGL